MQPLWGKKKQKILFDYGNYKSQDVISLIEMVTIEISGECEDRSLIRVIFFLLPLTILWGIFVELVLFLYNFFGINFSDLLYPYNRNDFIIWTVVTILWFVGDRGGTTPWSNPRDHGGNFFSFVRMGCLC